MHNFIIKISKGPSSVVKFEHDWLGNTSELLDREKISADNLSCISYGAEKKIFTEDDQLYVLINKFYVSNTNLNLFKELLKRYRSQTVDEYFNKFDGELSAIFIDLKSQKVVVYTDRFGLIPVYMCERENSIWISSSPKYIFLQDKTLKLRKKSIECFLENGHLLGKHSWFEKVTLVDSSNKVEVDLSDLSISSSFYWTWGEVEQVNYSFERSVDKLSEVFLNAVQKRKNVCSNNFLLLSGGMDSRLILAALDKSDLEYTATFSKTRSEELSIAKKLSAEKAVPHKHWVLDKSNWVDNRIENIWNLDCGISFLHDHAAPHNREIHKKGNGVYNGFGGGILFGGNDIDQPNISIGQDKIKKYYRDSWTEEKGESEFYNINKIEPYFLNTRLRRFTAVGTRSLLPNTPLLPFIDRDFLSLLMSIDDTHRKDRKLFNAVALKLDRNLFAKYTYTQLGRPITADKTIKYRLKGYTIHLMNKLFGIEYISYVNYKKWVSTIDPFISQIVSSRSILSEMIEIDIAKIYAEGNLELLGRVLSLEIYLQQILNNKYRSTKEIKLKKS